MLGCHRHRHFISPSSSPFFKSSVSSVIDSSPSPLFKSPSTHRHSSLGSNFKTTNSPLSGSVFTPSGSPLSSDSSLAPAPAPASPSSDREVFNFWYRARQPHLQVFNWLPLSSWCDSEIELGGPTNSSTPLPWAASLKIAQGSARGLTYIHEHSPRKYVPGNIKSTKILLNEDLQPYVSGFGLTRLILGSSKFTSSASRKNSSIQTNATSCFTVSTHSIYLAPEARISGSKFTQKCDVYCFGIVLMEILTGKVPDEGPENDGKGLESLMRKTFREVRPVSEIIDPELLQEVYAKKQVVEAFHIARNCTELDPELCPRMKTVSDSLDRIKLQL